MTVQVSLCQTWSETKPKDRFSPVKTHLIIMSVLIRAATRENRSSGFPTRCDTNRSVQSQEQARGLKFRLYVEEILYYPSSENKGADQLRGYREAGLRLCFRIGENPFFSRCGSLYMYYLNK